MAKLDLSGCKNSGETVSTNELSFAKSWRRLGLTEVWGIPILVFAIVVVSLSSLAFDAARLNNYTVLWFPINTLAFLCGLVIVVLFWWLGRRLNFSENERPYFNLATAATSMGVKNAATLFFCEVFGVPDSGNYLVRFFGGVGIGIGILLIYSNILGARIEQTKIQRELLDKEQYLIGFRENISEIFKEEEAELRKRTTDELMPRLTAIRESIRSSERPAEVAKRIQDFLRDEVKPISKALSEEASRLQRQIPASSVTLTPPEQIRLDYSRAIRPFASFIFVFICWMSMCQMFLKQATGLDVLLASLTYLFALLLYKYLTKAFKNASVNQILFTCWLPAFSASLPAYLLLYQIPHDPNSSVLMPTLLVVGACISMLFSQSMIIEARRAAIEVRLHGKVQAALTAATMRLSSKSTFSDEGREAILNDLNRAADALREPRLDLISVEDSLNAIRSTWEGISQIKFVADSALRKRINQNLESSLVVNEILKESVSNAIKHGMATEVEIQLSLDEVENLMISVENNGSKPTPRRADGIGSAIFNSLCLNTSLTWNGSTSKTEFVAVLPIA
ncbi:MAG: hypothetical protein EBT86_09535 [Actinobacteria bacterium]|nr:hypothetical protein [Actinomycetota bacterium]